MLVVVALVAAALLAPVATAATVGFDWNVGPANTVPERFLDPINATVGDTLLFHWTDPTTTPSGDMFHEVVQMDDSTCTFDTGYQALAEASRTNSDGDKTASTASVTLTTVRPRPCCARLPAGLLAHTV